MPVLQISRQPEALDWFTTPAGQSLLAAEWPLVRAAFAARPAPQPWLWLAPVPGTERQVEPPPRSLVLQRRQDGYAGSLRCGLPLPLPNESIGNLILQHVLQDGDDGLLEECERVLVPGGRLWLFTLNVCSPYRARWQQAGLVVGGVSAWQRRLRDLGLHPCAAELRHVGPVWRMSGRSHGPGLLRAACLLESEKRTSALIPPAPVKRQWHPAGAAPA